VTRWTAFAGVVGVVVLALLALARASQPLVRDDGSSPAPDGPGGASRTGGTAGGPPGHDATDGDDVDHAYTAAELAEEPFADPVAATGEDGRPDGRGRAAAGDDGRPDGRGTVAAAGDRRPPSLESMGPVALLANVGLTQGVLGGLVVAAAVAFAVPPAALGAAVPDARALALGAGLGVALYVANRAGAAVAARFGVSGDERLRELLAPDGAAGWAVLLLVVLPVVAGFEELLFRGALVGALSAGFGLSPWPLAAVSSVLFGLGHGAQGRGGVAVTTALGFVLAAAFVLTDSLAVVVVAHYLVNALEFVVHEALGVDLQG
jgi:membrane protease YdiL (CAAX protease family)